MKTIFIHIINDKKLSQRYSTYIFSNLLKNHNIFKLNKFKKKKIGVFFKKSV